MNDIPPQNVTGDNPDPHPDSPPPSVALPPTSQNPQPSQMSVLKRAQSSLRQTLKRYTSPPNTDSKEGNQSPLQADIQHQLEQLSSGLNKLEHGVLRIAVFGLVSRGKSSVINALLQENLLQTGPLHGVTKWPRSVYWEPKDNSSNLRVEFIDTPGLDEIDGTVRADMATDVAQEADLILFILAGEMTTVEHQALVKLLTQGKPLIIVCNKMDVYPEQDGTAILEQLKDSRVEFKQSQVSAIPGDGTKTEQVKTWPLTTEDMVQVAAAPAPIQVRVEWPDGQVTHEWEHPPAQMAALEHRLQHILHQDAPFLIALNALRNTQATEATIAEAAMQAHQEQAEDLLWQFAKWKGLVVAANPLAFVDVFGGVIIDLVMIRSLARLYGLPMTGYDAGALWNAIIWSSGGLLLAELGSNTLLGIGKTTGVTTGPLGGLTAYSTTAIAQATLAGHGTYRVGKAAQIYLKQGCTWGPHGASTVMQTLWDQTKQSSIMSRLRTDLEESNKDVC